MKHLYTAIWIGIHYSIFRYVGGFPIETSLIIALLVTISNQINNIKVTND